MGAAVCEAVAARARCSSPTAPCIARDRGTPQGSAVSPVLANLFLHYAFDAWMAREFPGVPFERYADDAVVHCVSERQARQVLAARSGTGWIEVGLRLHPDKTRIVYCQDGKRRGSTRAHVVHVPGLHVSARARRGTSTGAVRVVSARDQQGRPEQDRSGGAALAAAPPHRSHLRRSRADDQPDRAGLDAVLRGVLPSALYPLLSRINAYLMRWVRKKYKRLRADKKAILLAADHPPYPRLFAHWAWVPRFLVTRMTRAR